MADTRMLTGEDGKYLADKIVININAIAGKAEKADVTALTGRVAANETAIANRYTKAETDALIADELDKFDKLDYKIADSVPTPTEVVIGGETVPTETGVRYLVKHATDDNFEEYVLIDGKIYDIGSTADVDLSEYYDKTETDALLADKQDKIAGGTDAQVLMKNGDTEGDFEWKTLKGSGWGVAKIGVVTVASDPDNPDPYTNTLATKLVDIEELGISSKNDYDVLFRFSDGAVTPDTAKFAFVWSKSVSDFIAAVKLSAKPSTRLEIELVYVVVAKGFGAANAGNVPLGGTTGQALIKKSNTDGDVAWGDADKLFYIPIEETDLTPSATQGEGVKEGVLTTPYTFEEIYANYKEGKLCIAMLSNAADNTDDIPLTLGFSGDAETTGSQAWCEHTYFDYGSGSVTKPKPMMLTLSIVKQSTSTKVYITRTEYGSGGNPTINDVLANGNEATQKTLVMKDTYGVGTNESMTITSNEIIYNYDDGAENNSFSINDGGFTFGVVGSDGSESHFDYMGGYLHLDAADKDGNENHFEMNFTDPKFITVNVSDGLKEALQTAFEIGNPQELTTPSADSIVAALNSVQTEIDGLGEPFRVKSWNNRSLTVNIPVCTQDMANTSIPKFEYTISDEEGADYQIVGMIAYEVFDASDNRINCWPVCQFTGNGQKTLTVRMMCAGTEQKTAKRINAWVLLKHR